MAGDCNYRNPLKRSGVSQQARLLKALLPLYARVDERTPADLILFAKEYARYLNYYNDKIIADKNEVAHPDGDWTALMKMDVSVSLATLSKLDTAGCFIYYDYLINTIAQTDSTNTADLKKYYRAVYDFAYSLVYSLDEEYQHLPAGFEFAEYSGNMIGSRLNELFWRINEYYKQSDIAENLIDHTVFFVPDNAPIGISSVEKLTINDLSAQWNYTPVTPFTFTVEGTTDGEKIKYISQHSIFKGTIVLLLKSIANVSKQSENWLNKTLESFPTHAPHYALYLTFIKLFGYAQQHLNDYTKRHLDFYYKDVLRLVNKPAQPDAVHLVIELAKQTASHLLEKNTIFKAGKDATGAEMFYAATDDAVLNKAAVKKIQSVTAINEAGNFKIYAAPVSNSGDGKGATLTSTDKSWKPFGDSKKNDFARTGFAVAHSLLFMKEGTRIAVISFECGDVSALTGKNIKDWFTVQYTGIKKWEDAELLVTYIDIFSNKIYLFVAITDDKPAVVAYNEKIHMAGYISALPVMEFTVNTKAVFHNPHVPLQLAQIKNIEIFVLVLGLKDVSIQNELSVLDAAKPFEIFGPQPHTGSSFIVGSNEIFLKNKKAPVTTTMTIEWDKANKLTAPPFDNYPFYTDKNIRVKYLQNGVWKEDPLDPGLQQVILHHAHSIVNGIEYHVNLTENISLHLPSFDTLFNNAPNSPYSITSKEGFMKLEFAGPTDFGHGDYVKRFTEAALATNPVVPPEPYTPTVKSLSINYYARSNFAVNNAAGINDDEEGHFYHLYPFGHAEQNAVLTGAGTIVNILPSFSNEGEIFIGLENCTADESVQMLFQLSEGSANPLRDVQDISWYYLSANNQWTAFNDKSLADASNDLTISGIIKFGFPHNATDNNSVMSEKLFWIRGTVKQNTDACCNIIELYAQAIKAKFTDYGGKGNYFKSILPASTISKLLISDAAVKKIQQPYNSYGGRVLESDDQFSIRVSERLRHKNRGIAMWDYERLVLQNFTEIYKVKCINHTKITLMGNTENDNEMAPGHVVIIPIPDLHDKNAIDPLKPMTSIGVLNLIEQYLKKHISPFVQLQVKNARFEEIQLDFKVKFNSDDGAFYHDVLTNEIEQFLTPWAYNADADIAFGGSMYKSVLLNFVEERPYVDFVTCFKMFHYVDGVRSVDIDEAIATSARSIMVSFGGTALNPKHIIDYVNHDCNCS